MGTHLDIDNAAMSDEPNARLFDCIDALTYALASAEDAAAVSAAARLQGFSEALGVLATTADDAALPGLIDVSALLIERIDALAEASEPRRETACEWLARFPLVLMDYVAMPTEPATGEAMLDFLRDAAGELAMGDEELELLRLLLLPPEETADESETPEASVDPAREPEATPSEKPQPEGTSDIDLALDEPPVATESAEREAFDAGTLATAPIELAFDPQQPQAVSADMLALALEALELNFAGLDDALALATNADRQQRPLGWEQVTEEIERMAGGAEAIGLSVLGQVLLAARALLDQRDDRVDSAIEIMAALLAELPEVLRGYLSVPTDAARADALAQLLQDLDLEGQLRVDWTQLSQALTHLELVEPETPESEARPLRASSDDVSLAPPSDINQELLEGLLIELPIQTGAFTEAIQRIASGQGRIADIDIAKRAAHTLKGAANTVGIKGIANLTHYLEDILIALAEHSALPNLGLSQTLGYAADCLEAMSEALVGAGHEPDDAADVLQDVLNWANRIDAQGIEVAAAPRPSGTPDPAADLKDARQTRPETAVAPMLRVPTGLVDEQLRLVGESMTATAQIQNRLQFVTQQLHAVNQQNAMLRQLVNELEDLVDLRGIALPQPILSDTGFDALELDQYGELHTVTRRLVEVTTDASEMTRDAQEHLNELHDLAGQQSRLHLASQDAVLRARMVPVDSVVSRLQRAVRQAGRLLDKEVELHLHGTATLVDGNVLNELVDALMHILRNAVDHGIEAVDARLAAGKDAVGHIELAFKREGDVISVTCRDDGRGLDLDHIRRVAQRRRLIGANDSLTDDQVARLTLMAGFSTRDEATQVSGRGIGLDAVNTLVEELKGSIGLQSEPGRGLTVEIRLPTTLLSAQALLVRLKGTMLALATRGIEEIHFVTLDQLQHIGSQLTYRQGDQIHDAVRLSDLLRLRGHAHAPTKQEQALLVVRMSSGLAKAVLVEEIAENRSLVVKKLGPYVGRIAGILGATILGDGSVAPVIDLPDLLRAESSDDLVHANGLAHAPYDYPLEALSTPSTGRTALVVDDSISARRLTAQLFRDAGFEVRTAIDGLDAVEVLDDLVPDIVMTDLEMPRMNGLELTAHIRARTDTKQVPVIMITSRSTEKHRQQAQAKGVDLYLTKPFNTDDLLRHVGALVAR